MELLLYASAPVSAGEYIGVALYRASLCGATSFVIAREKDTLAIILDDAREAAATWLDLYTATVHRKMDIREFARAHGQHIRAMHEA